MKKNYKIFYRISETIEGVCQYGQQIDVSEEQFKKLSEGEPFVLEGHKVSFRLFKEETFSFVTEIYLKKK